MTVRVACPGDPSAAVVEHYSRSWSAETGATVEVRRYNSGAVPPAADAWAIAAVDLPRLAAADQLQPVPDTYTSLRDNPYYWTDLLPLYRSLLLQWNGKPYALPLVGDGVVCFYRNDLFADARTRDAFRKKYGRELSAPATWDEYADIAEFFQSGNGRPSLPPLPDDAAGLDQEFYTVAAPFVVCSLAAGKDRPKLPDEAFAFQYDLNGRPNIDSPGFVHALALLQRLQKCRAAGAVHEPAESFRKGDAVLCLASPAWAARFEDPSSPVRGKFEVCRVPGSQQVFVSEKLANLGAAVNHVAYLGGGWLGVVPTTSAQSEAAFDLLADLSGQKTGREIFVDSLWGGGPLRRSHFQNADDWNAFGLDRARTTTLRESVRQGLEPLPINPALRLRVPEQDKYRQALVEELKTALSEATEPKKALEKVTQRWRDIDAATKEGSAQADYRRSIGR